MRTLSIRVRNWCVHWAYAPGTDAYCEHTGQELMRALSIRVRNWSCTERTYEIWKGTFKTCWAYASGTDAYTEHTPKELMRALSRRARNWCVSSACASEIKWCLAPLKILIISLYFTFSPKVTYPERLYGVKILKIRGIENLTLGHL